MSRKDYQLIAAAVREAKATGQSADHTIAKALESDNPRFDRDRFIEACRVR